VSERMPDQIFISYSHADRKWLDEFQTMLAPAAGLVDVWSDERLRAGDDWQTQLRIALSQARVALLLVTAEFLSSPFIREKELRSILAAANDGALTLFWVPISASLFEYTDLGKMQAACNPSPTLEDMSAAERRNAIATVCRKILDRLGQLPLVTRDDRDSLRASVGKRLAPKYRIGEEIDTGATSIVFKGYDSFGCPVAIKTLVGSALQPHNKEELQKQVELARGLRSPAYLRILDDYLGDAPQTVVSEFTDACGLNCYLELSNVVPPRRVKNILLDLATALAEAHVKGCLHDGLLPSNVYIDADHHARISAFRFLDVAPEVGRWGTFTVTHETCTYLTPEQFKGHPRTPLSDQYALGLIGRELLTGRGIDPIYCPADFVNRPQVYQALERDELACPSSGLAGIVSKLLRVDPADRWDSMQEVVELLSDVVVHDTDTDKLRREAVSSYAQLQTGDGERRLYRAVYHHLFELVPEVRALFAEAPTERQYAALNRAIKLLLDYSPARPKSILAVREIARHHAQFRLDDHHIDAFSSALLLALRDCNQSPEVVEAWRRVLTAGLDEMRRTLASNLDSLPNSARPTQPLAIAAPHLSA
jgi:serine/threonine protein kinase